jgi:hypothetical protein
MSNDPRVEDIRRRAYELYEQRGREDGHDVDDWFEAEREIKVAELQHESVEPMVATIARRRSNRRVELPNPV